MPILSDFRITNPFPDTASLSAYIVALMQTGTTAIVNDIFAMFRYDSTSAATVDGELVLAANGAGRWLRMTDSRIRPDEPNVGRIQLRPEPGSYDDFTLTNNASYERNLVIDNDAM